jgi:hypothetical protein
MIDTRGRLRSAASRMPRRATRNPPGPSGSSSALAVSILTRGRCRASHRSGPAPTTFRGRARPVRSHATTSTSDAPSLSRVFTPGRSVRRDNRMESQARSRAVRDRHTGPRHAPVPRGRGTGAWSVCRASSTDKRPRRHLGEPLDRHHRVDDAAGVEVLGDLDALGERPSVERLVDAGAEEPDHRSRLGDRDVAQGPPRGQHAAGRRVAQIDDVGQSGGLELGDGGRDLDHAEEGRRAFLHPRAPRGRSGEEGQPLVSSALEGQRDPLGGSPPIDPARKRNSPVTQATRRPRMRAFAGEHRLVGAGRPRPRRRARRHTCCRARRRPAAGRPRTDPAALVQDGAQQLAGSDAPRCAHGPAFRSGL